MAATKPIAVIAIAIGSGAIWFWIVSTTRKILARSRRLSDKAGSKA